jgi:hypothetical protein
MISIFQQAIVLSTLPQKILDRDFQRAAMTFQNQEAAATIYRRFGGDGTARSYMAYPPNGFATEIKDQFCPPDELWAYSDVAGAILTLEITIDSERGLA